MAEKGAQKAVTDAIIDSDLAAAKLVQEAAEGAPSISAALTRLSRQVVQLRAQGKLTADQAREVLRRAFEGNMLVQSARLAGKVKAHVEERHDAEQRAVAGFEGSLTQVPAIRKTDVKARELELAGAVDAQGRLDA